MQAHISLRGFELGAKTAGDPLELLSVDVPVRELVRCEVESRPDTFNAFPPLVSSAVVTIEAPCGIRTGGPLDPHRRNELIHRLLLTADAAPAIAAVYPVALTST